MTEADAKDAQKPPYVSYTTLCKFIDEKVGASEIAPPRIDRGLLDTYAGSVQAQMLYALKVMGLTTDDGTSTADLRLAARHPSERKQVFKRWATDFYATQQALASENGTGQQLAESFKDAGYQGSTLRKAVVFYLALVEDTGLTKSPFFKPPKQTGSPNGSRPKKAVPKPPNGGTTPSNPATIHTGTSVGGETVTVDFGSAGTVVLDVKVKWLELPVKTFTDLRGLIDKMTALALGAGVTSITDEDDQGGAS